MPQFNVWVQYRSNRKNLSLEWHDPETGKRRSMTAGTSDPAVASKRATELAVKLEHRIHDNSARMTWDRFLEQYRDEHLCGLRPATRELAETVFRVFDQECSPRQLRHVNERMLSKFAGALRGREMRSGAVGLAPKSIVAYLTILKMVLRWACQQRLIERVPRFPSIKVPRKRPQPVPQEDFDRLLAVAPTKEWRAYLLCGWYGGLRRYEAQQLRRRPSDRWPYIAEGRINFPAEFSKSGRDDWLPLHGRLAEAIAAIPDQDDDVVFPTIQRICRRAISWHMQRMAKKAGVRLTMHKLRKGFGCRVAKMAGKGGAAYLHRMMRHSNMQVTMDYYVSVDDALEDKMKELV